MTYDEFVPRYRRLVKAFSKPESGEQCAAYHETLKNFPEAIVEGAIAKVIADERFFPPASVLREAANSILAGKVYTPPACPQCHGDLMVDAEDRSVQGVTYKNWVKPCPTCRQAALNEGAA